MRMKMVCDDRTLRDVANEFLALKKAAYSGVSVQHMYFHELDISEKYDGIWACSSILHVKTKELPDILARLCRALVTGGHLYTSFKYGSFSGDRNGRFFSDFTENRFRELLATVPGLHIIETMITADVRSGREHEKWLNLILKRVY